MPTHARSNNTSAKVKTTTTETTPSMPPANGGGGGGGEDDMINAMFAASGQQWAATQERMQGGTRIYSTNTGGAARPRPNTANLPDHPPPAGYVCYRCGERGHWIQLCPTLDDPKFDGKSRVKRTTGIPRSFLKTVAKPELDADGNAVGGGVMVDGNGEYVIAQADNESWNKYVARTTQVKSDDIYTQPVPEDMSDAKCPICHNLMRKAVKTPCCGKSYCEECIQQALLDSDLVCPGCGTPETLLDALVPNDELQARIDAYVKEHESNKRPAEEEQQDDEEEEETSTKRARTEPSPQPALLPPQLPQPPLIPFNPFMMPNPMQMMMMGMPMPPPHSPNPKK